MMLSKEFVVKYDDVVIAKCVDFDLEVNKSVIEMTNLDSDSWREIKVDMKEWRISFNALIARTGNNRYDQLLTELKTNDDAVTVSIGGKVEGAWYEEGDAFLTTLRLSGSVGDRATYSGTLEGTGILETKTVPA